MMVTEPRLIKIFISSTFRDMKAERDELVKFVFPKLKKVCSLRNVGLIELELRWGVTTEEALQGKALEICLEEVDYCRPFFIGILGERYGWIPSSFLPSLLRKFPWVKSMTGKSISEIEITYGAFMHKDEVVHPYFYFRDPSYVKQMADQSSLADFESENLSAHEKQLALKKRITENDHCIYKHYKTPKEFSELVYMDLLKMINQLYPAVLCESEEDTEEQQQEAFSRNLCEFYIQQEDHWKKLDQFMNSSSSLLVVSGESGTGKSTLLANWVKDFQMKHPEILLITHFVDSTALSSDYSFMLRKCLRKMNLELDLNIEIPKQIADLRNSFANALYMASKKKPILLLIDSVDLLNNADASSELVWLPSRIPENVHVIISAKPGEIIEKLQSRNFELLKTRPFTKEECLQLIQSYLSIYRKRLPEEAIQKILMAPKTMNPLFLHTLLFELRLYGDHDTLKEWLEHLLQAESVSSLFDLILSRYERDYNRDRPNLVQDTLSLIQCSRYGLSETELLDLLGEEGRPLPIAYWAYLSIASGPMLVSQSGLLKIFHTFFQKAIENRYLKNSDAKTAVHHKLSKYWEYQENSPRKFMEYPWHLVLSKNYAQLVNELTNMHFFADMFEHHKDDLFSYWNKIESDSPYRKEIAYQPYIKRPETAPISSLVSLAEFFMKTGLTEESLQLCADLEKRCKEENNQQCLIQTFNIKADVLKTKGNLKEAWLICQQNETLLEKTVDSKDRVIAINAQASILYQLGKWPEAFEMFKKAEQVAKNIQDQIRLSEAINNQALVLENWGKLDEAWKLHKESEIISREMHDLLGLSISLNYQAKILRTWNRSDEALLRYQEAETISRDLGDLFSIALSLNNQALILSSEKKLVEAGNLYKEAEKIFRKLDDQTQLSALLINQADLLKNWGKLEEAWDVYKEAEALFRRFENPLKLSICLNNEASILHEWGKWQDALLLYREAEQIFRNLQFQKGIAITLSHQGSILLEQNQQDEALKFLKEAMQIAKENKLIQVEEQIQKKINTIYQS